MDLANRSILLTGGGSGIGRATAVALAHLGGRLTLVARHQAPLEATAHLVEEAGGQAHIVVGDITRAEDRNQFVQSATERFGGLDILINNAGNVRAGRLERISDEEIEAQITVNLLAPILLTRSALPALRHSRDAAIVNVSSGIALVGMPFYATYAATKAGLARFSEALRRELYDEGVRVLTVYPSATRTPMMDSSKAGPEVGFDFESPEAVAEALVQALQTNALEVIRGGGTRKAMIEKNQAHPEEVDALLAQRKDALEEAVAEHSSL